MSIRGTGTVPIGTAGKTVKLKRFIGNGFMITDLTNAITPKELEYFTNLLEPGLIVNLPIEEDKYTPEELRKGIRLRRGFTEETYRMTVKEKHSHTVTLEYRLNGRRFIRTPSYVQVMVAMIRKYGRWNYGDGIFRGMEP